MTTLPEVAPPSDNGGKGANVGSGDTSEVTLGALPDRRGEVGALDGRMGFDAAIGRASESVEAAGNFSWPQML